MKYATVNPVTSADSGWPSPDMRWHPPHASMPGRPLMTGSGAGGCWSGNQSGGAFRLSISFGVYLRVLPGIVFGSSDSAGSCASITWNAHDGSRGTGLGSGVCDLTVAETASAIANTSIHTRACIKVLRQEHQAAER